MINEFEEHLKIQNDSDEYQPPVETEDDDWPLTYDSYQKRRRQLPSVTPGHETTASTSKTYGVKDQQQQATTSNYSIQLQQPPLTATNESARQATSGDSYEHWLLTATEWRRRPTSWQWLATGDNDNSKLQPAVTDDDNLQLTGDSSQHWLATSDNSDQRPSSKVRRIGYRSPKWPNNWRFWAKICTLMLFNRWLMRTPVWRTWTRRTVNTETILPSMHRLGDARCGRRLRVEQDFVAGTCLFLIFS